MSVVLSQFPARFGKYILLDRLAAGGMAEVFRAKITGAENFERLVAIKCMLPQLLEDEQFTSMFVDEAKLAAQLAHANIVQIYELGREGERLYIAMELVHGRDVRHIVRSTKGEHIPLAPRFAAYVISRAALGLDFAHRRMNIEGQPLNLVHRDVSPQNILVSYDGEVKVVDFGIARAEMRRTETQTGMLKGKFAYMSPEQVQGLPFDRRADIFALGSVLFEMLTGERLFAGENELTVLERVREAAIPDLKEALGAPCQALRHVLVRALAREPEDRYAWASEMSEDLEAFLIEDRSIFAAKRAAQVMGELYGAEINLNSAKLREYAALSDADLADEHADLEDEAPAQAIFAGGLPAPAAREPTLTRAPASPAATAARPPPEAQGEAPAEAEAAAEPEAPGAAPRDWRSLTSLGQQRSRLTAREAATGETTGATTAVNARGAAARRHEAAPAPEPGSDAQLGSQEEDEEARPSPPRRRPRRRPASRALWSMRLAMLASLAFTFGLIMVATLKLQREGHIGALAGPRWLPAMFSQFLPPVADGDAADADADALGHDGRQGWLVIRSVSGGQPVVRIDGRVVGNLPLPPQRLAVGSHEVVLEASGEEAGGRRSRRAPVTISPNHTERAPRLLSF